MIGRSRCGDAGSPMTTRAPVSLASSSSGLSSSGSMTMIARGLRAVSVSRLSRGMVSDAQAR